MVDLGHYENREHAKAKHDLLERYIARYTMILGRHAAELAFVDGFAGPWQSGAVDRSDTSFGLSAAALRKCAETLYARFRRRPAIRALWIEADPSAYALLNDFARRTSDSRVQIRAECAAFQDSIQLIAGFVGDESYAFIFIDPRGYKGLIEPQVLAPLLRIPKVELLVNYMWDHIRYAFGRADETGHRSNLEQLYGAQLERLLKIEDGGLLALEALKVYEDRLRQFAGGTADRLRVLSYPILDTHGHRYPKYWLVHATHAATGLSTFADECEKTHRTQAAIFHVANVARKEQKTGTSDLFREEAEAGVRSVRKAIPETAAWLEFLPEIGAAKPVDTEAWAGLLERARCLPQDLQEGFRCLRDDGVLENMDAKKKRTARYVHCEKAERVRRCT